MRRRGVWLTFIDGERRPEQLPMLGPFIDAVFTRDRLVAERVDVSHDAASEAESGGEWLAAELSLKRATGELLASTRRATTTYVVRPDGDDIFLRFSNYTTGDPGTKDLGPFKAISIRPKQIEAGGAVLATHTADRTWRLTEACGSFAGGEWPDVAVRDRASQFRALTAAPSSAPARERHHAPARAPEAIAPARSHAPKVTTPRAQPEEQADVRETERPVGRAMERASSRGAARSARRETRTETAPAPAPRRRGNAPALSSLPPVPVLLAGVLALFVAGGLVVWQVKPSVGQAAPAVTDEGQTVTGGQFDYVVSGSDRVGAIGSASPRGAFLVVHLVITNRESSGRVQPSAFTLAGEGGQSISPAGLDSGAYGANVNSKPVQWPDAFPRDTQVAGDLVFDTPPNARGWQLVVPGTTTRIRIAR